MATLKSDETTSWNIERSIEFSFSSSKDLVWDGRFVIVSNSTSVSFLPYELFDRSHMDDISLVAGAVGTPRKEEYLNKISNEDIISRSVTGFWLAPYNGGVFVTNAKVFWNTIYFINPINADEVEITCPVSMNSNLLCCNGKLWMTQTKHGGDQLYIYDIATDTWSHTLIPVREQQEIRHISHDKNNHVLITNFNDWSVCKFTVGGSFIEKIFLDGTDGRNKEPSFIFTDTERNTFVASYNGMISLMNTTTNTVEHFAYSGKPAHHYFEDFWGFESDGTDLWVSMVGPSKISPAGDSSDSSTLNRVTIDTKYMVGTDYGDPVELPGLTYNYEEHTISISTTKSETGAVMESGYFLNKGWSPSAWKKVIIIPQMTKQVWNGSSFETKTYGSHVCVLHDSGLFAFPNSALWRVNNVEVGSTAMISSGPYNYTGD